jgi:6-phosphogluconolactonase (cycloisomerase 2 family)
MYTRKQISLIALFVVISITAWHCRDAAARSVYAITNHDTSTITAYNVNDVNLDFQITVPNFPNHEEGAVGLALDPESEILFVTYELSNIIEMVNAKTMIWEQNPVTVPQATGLAGIVFDEA